MSAKYDLLASKISGFDAEELSNRQGLKKGGRCNWQRCIAVSVVVGLLILALLTLVVIVVVEVTRNRSASPSSQCPSDLPSVMVPCSSSVNADTEDLCIDAGCCWYSNQCILKGYQATCTGITNKMFTCLPENDNWNDTYARAECNRRGCCWNKLSNQAVKCFYPSEYGYQTQDDSSKQTGNRRTVSIVRRSLQPTMYSTDIQELTVEVTHLTSSIVRVKVLLYV